jgi:3-methyladenine DNA glycosylase AlkD
LGESVPDPCVLRLGNDSRLVGDKTGKLRNLNYNSIMNAAQFLKRLKALRSPAVAKSHAHLASNSDDIILGIRMGQVFSLAKEFMNMELDEVEKMLESPIHEMRVGAVGIMDFQARSKKTTNKRRKELLDLYIRRHDRINTWDLVDRSAPWVVGSFLIDKSRKVLYQLAKSKKMPERRTAIVSTLFLIGKGDVDDAFKLAEIMLYDKEDLIHKANGWALRFAGDKDRKQLLMFLDKHAVDMPRVTLRYAAEHLDKKQREYYLKLKSQG